MRRNEAAEAAMTALARITRTAAARRAEVESLYRPCGLESIIARQLADVEAWQAREAGKVLALLPGGVAALSRWINDRAAERLAELDREAAERRRLAAAHEADRVQFDRARAAVTASPADALALLPRAADVSAWLDEQIAVIDQMPLIESIGTVTAEEK